jgi:DNA-binding response OmpR family regulator
MINIALIEDDEPTSNQLRQWISAAKPEARVDQWFNRDDAEAALLREQYDLVILDIELGRERHAGVAIINAINKHSATPVLVVSAMPATIYRSIMKALDAWDYLQKPPSAKMISSKLCWKFCVRYVRKNRSKKPHRNRSASALIPYASAIRSGAVSA